MRNGKRKGAVAAVALAAQLLIGAASSGGDFAERVLAAHNRARTSEGVPPLAWNARLALDAADYAATLAQRGYLVHSPDQPGDPDPEGENLWAGTRGYYTPEQMVGLWISERRDFRPGIFPGVSRSGNIERVGHYTQLMWRSSRAVGCARAQGRRDDFLVCRYSEGGNVIGERPF